MQRKIEKIFLVSDIIASEMAPGSITKGILQIVSITKGILFTASQCLKKQF